MPLNRPDPPHDLQRLGENCECVITPSAEPVANGRTIAPCPSQSGHRVEMPFGTFHSTLTLAAPLADKTP